MEERIRRFAINHLHCHSQYSILDGLSTVKEIVTRAKSIHATVAAITDHASISALPDLMQEAKLAGIKPVVGCEFYVVESYEKGGIADKKRLHLCVWAKSWGGVQSIMRQLTVANAQFYRRPVISIAQALEFQDCLVGTACCFGVLAHDDYENTFDLLHRAYGSSLYVEVMPHEVHVGGEVEDRQRVVNERGIALAAKYGVKLLATNDSHYTLEADAPAHSLMMATQYKKTIAEHEAWPAVFFMRDMAQMFGAFTGLGYVKHDDIAEAMKNTLSIADMINIEMPVFSVNLPKVHDDEGRHVIDQCLAGWKSKLSRKIGAEYQEYRKRLVYELEIIKNAGFIPYFCMVQDMIKWARNNGIMVGPARGSSAGSLVCYLMDITRVDPIKHGLYFERFLNPERNDLPDIDVDFQDDRRGEVLEYIIEKYGRDNVGQISTYSSTTIKGSFRDIARAYGANIAQVNNISRQLVEEEGEEIEDIPDVKAFSKSFPQVIPYAKRLSGTIRAAGCHACGVVISGKPLDDICAMERRKEGTVVTCWDKDQCETFGLVKMDLLGLTTLSIINRALGIIDKHYGKRIVVEDIALDDAKTLEQFSTGNCDCVFQFESHGMQELLRSLNASDFETLVATTALYRPGPLKAGLTDRYAKVAAGTEYPRYSIPALEPILQNTNSVLVYQEQIMQVFNQIGGFTWSEADKMRKIIGKKLGADAFEEHREHFVSGCVKNGFDKAAASSLFDEMVGFAAYSFNRSHAVAYTMISFWSMYLKTHFPAIFLSCYMTHAKDDESLTRGISEARRMGIPVQYPDVNISTTAYDYKVDDGSIVAPLSAIKGVGGKAVDEIIRARNETGFVFTSMDDFLARVTKRVVNKRVVENLVLAGAFSSIGITEPDEEVKERAAAELMPAFGAMPTLSFSVDSPIDTVEIDAIRSEVISFCNATGRKPLHSWHGKAPVVMILNGQMKGETVLGTAKGTAPIFKQLKEVGVDPKFVSYLALNKVLLADPRNMPTDVRVSGEAWLRREIKAMSPKAIYCCNAEAFNVLFPGDKISKMHGRILYSKEFGVYVVPGPSPQHASFRPGDVGEQYMSCINKIGEMFGGKK